MQVETLPHDPRTRALHDELLAVRAFARDLAARYAATLALARYATHCPPCGGVPCTCGYTTARTTLAALEETAR